MKKRSLKKVALTLAAALAASAVLTACSSKTGSSDTQPASAEAGGATGTEGTAGEEGGSKKDTLNVGISAEPATLDPHLQSGQATRLIKQQIYRGLMTYTADSSIETDVADSYTVSDDGLTYTFLLKDATFHDGSPVTAEDVSV